MIAAAERSMMSSDNRDPPQRDLHSVPYQTLSEKRSLNFLFPTVLSAALCRSLPLPARQQL